MPSLYRDVLTSTWTQPEFSGTTDEQPLPDLPELRLVRATLEDALLLVTKPLRPSDRPWVHSVVEADARRWITSTSGRVWGFEWCCMLLRLDAPYVRRMTLAHVDPGLVLRGHGQQRGKRPRVWQRPARRGPERFAGV